MMLLELAVIAFAICLCSYLFMRWVGLFGSGSDDWGDRPPPGSDDDRKDN